MLRFLALLMNRARSSTKLETLVAPVGFFQKFAKPPSFYTITMPMDDIILKIAFWSWRHEELKFTTIDRYTSLLPCLTLQIEQNKAALQTLQLVVSPPLFCFFKPLNQNKPTTIVTLCQWNLLLLLPTFQFQNVNKVHVGGAFALIMPNFCFTQVVNS